MPSWLFTLYSEGSDQRGIGICSAVGLVASGRVQIRAPAMCSFWAPTRCACFPSASAGGAPYSVGRDRSTQRWFLGAVGWGTGIPPSSDCSVKVAKMILHGSRKLFLVFVTLGKLAGTPDDSYIYFWLCGSLLLPGLSSVAASRGPSPVVVSRLLLAAASLVVERRL